MASAIKPPQIALTKSTILSTYRTLSRLVRRQPAPANTSQLEILRTSFRANASLEDPDQIRLKVHEAGEKIAYLRIITPKKASSAAAATHPTSGNGKARWVYTKDGVREIFGDGTGGTLRKSDGTVISNWNGKNLDPCSVKTHQGQLKRAGFMNNLHAKGIF